MRSRLFCLFILLSLVSLGFPASFRKLLVPRATTECCTAVVSSSNSTIIETVFGLLGLSLDNPVDAGVGCGLVPVAGNCAVGKKVSCDTPLNAGGVSICLPGSAVLRGNAIFLVKPVTSVRTEWMLCFLVMSLQSSIKGGTDRWNPGKPERSQYPSNTPALRVNSPSKLRMPLRRLWDHLFFPRRSDAYLAGTMGTSAGAAPATGSNSWADQSENVTAPIESAIWDYDQNTHKLTAQWVNTNGSPAAATHIVLDTIIKSH
ncbi:hypothetical protein B0H14DRAFT_2643528 [Mycena olivaceomarginata]|nr:hypothetical protein B0H14DRAFT_2643528 [Mycena olivaceomarginata]